MKKGYVYILANQKHGTLYIGVTADLCHRISEHKAEKTKGFTQKYKVHRLVYFEEYESIYEAIEREKQLKPWKRAWKIELIEKSNHDWNELYYSACE